MRRAADRPIGSAGEARITVQAMPLCEIIYVKSKEGNGWKWRPISLDRERHPSEQTYQLFYECVTAARASGYTPNQKCL